MSEACDPCGLAGTALLWQGFHGCRRCCRKRPPTAAAFPAGGTGPQAGGSGRQGGRERSLPAAGLARAVGGLQAWSLQGAWSDVECLILPGKVFVLLVMAWGWLRVFFCCCLFLPSFYYFFFRPLHLCFDLFLLRWFEQKYELSVWMSERQSLCL